MGTSGNLPGTRGVQVFGSRNLITMTANAHDPGQNLIFEAPARDNLVIAVNLANGITNNATQPTNRVTTTWPVGYAVNTPAVPKSTKVCVNREPYTIDVNILNPGNVSIWTKTDANGESISFAGALTLGQSILLDPGDSISFEYTAAPQWKWKAMR